MGLCIVLKEELRLKNIGFYIANTDCFFNFQGYDWLGFQCQAPVTLYIAYRLLLALYTTSWTCYSFLATSNSSDWAIHLTNWTYTLLNMCTVAHFLLALIKSCICKGHNTASCFQRSSVVSPLNNVTVTSDVYAQFSSREDADIKATHDETNETQDCSAYQSDELNLVSVSYCTKHRCAWYICIVWAMWSTVSTAALGVSIVFFLFLYPLSDHHHHIGLINLQVHIVNSVIVVIERIVSDVPCCLMHVVYPMLWGASYVVFSIIYWAGDHSRIIYPIILDWNHPLVVVCYMLLFFFLFMPSLHVFLFLIYKGKTALYARLTILMNNLQV